MDDPSFERLTTPRLLIRRFALADAESFAAYRSDPDVARYQDWESPCTVSAARQFISGLDRLAPGTPGAWFQFAVCLATSGALIGDAALGTGRDDGRQGELGFTFAAAHQGKGYATEALHAVVGYAFAQLAMQRLFARTDLRNVRAQRLLERLCFRREGKLRDALFKGERVTDVLYAQIASEWRP